MQHSSGSGTTAGQIEQALIYQRIESPLPSLAEEERAGY